MKRSQFTVPYETFDEIRKNNYWIEAARGEQNEENKQEVPQNTIRNEILHALNREVGVEVATSAGIKMAGGTLKQLNINTDSNDIVFEGVATGITSLNSDESEDYKMDFHVEDRGERGLEFYVRYEKLS